MTESATCALLPLVVNKGTKPFTQDPDEHVICALASEHHKDIPRTRV
jgi:hypothetical protein